ncbi:MAG: hypothetical protein R2729_31075 [Bryobacteraceae bacterium]
MTPAAVLVHSEMDAAIAAEAAAFLRTGTRFRVSTDDGCIRAGEPLLDTLRRALSAEIAVALLSPAALAVRSSGAEWADAFEEAPEARVASLILTPCAPPALLRRRRIFEDPERMVALRQLKRWLIDAPPPATDRLPAPATDAISSAEIDGLRHRLGDRPGAATLAASSPMLSAFVHAHWADFEGVVWLDCANRPKENFIAELAARIGVAAEGPYTADLEAVERALAGRRLLLAFENMEFAPDHGEWCSLIATEPAGQRDEEPAGVLEAMRGWHRDPAEATALLPRAEGAFAATIAGDWDTAKQIARLAFLLTNNRRRFAEAVLWLDRLANGALHHGDRGAALDSAREKVWILEQWGRSTDAAPREPCAEPVQLSLFGDGAMAAAGV